MIAAKTNLVSFTFREKRIAVFERSMPLLDIYKLSEETSRNSGKELAPIGPALADLLLHSGVRADILRNSPFATSGLIAYGKANSELGSEIVYEDHSGIRMVMPSGRYKGERSIALFFPSMRACNLEQCGREIFISIDDDKFVPIPFFPDASGWHGTFKDTKIPHGEALPEGEGRYLSRAISAYVGPIARGYSFDGHGKDHICADFAPWYHLGAVFEVK